MAYLVSDLIRQAYLLAQVWDPGEEQPGDEANLGLLTLNDLISEWAEQDTFIPAYNTLIITLTQGEYLNAVTPRIIDVLEANIVDSTNCKTILQEANLQEFNLFNFVDLEGKPSRFYVEQKFSDIQTTSNLYTYPAADTTYTATFYVKQVIEEFEYSEDLINLPKNYRKPLRYQLAKDLADIYGTTLSKRFDNEYQKIIDNLKAVNRKDLSVQAPNPFNGQRRFKPWNIYTG
jgi:hypothetical protein